MSYYSSTYDSPNPLIRYAHRQRLSTAIKLVDISPELHLLDYGCGDGLFLRELAARYRCADRLFGYEPYMKALPDSQTTIFRDWTAVEENFPPKWPASIVTCFEVLEHFSPEAQERALVAMKSVLAKDGRAIVSVPIECGLPAVPKNVFRWLRHGRKQPDVYNLGNIARSIVATPIPACRTGSDYLSHMGFYYRDLEKVFEKHFSIISRSFSPFPWLGAQFNSQVFYVLV